MTHHTWTDRLSEYVDGELDAAATRALELHLAGCAECRAIADDLRTVSARARALPELPARGDLWPGIASRMQAADVVPLRPRASRGLFISWPRLAAAGLFLALAAGAAMFATARYASRSTVVAAAPVDLAPASPVAVPTETHAGLRVTASTARAVADLEMILASEKLDSGTVRVLSLNLARIDSAIADAERALAADPSNAYVSRHLASTARRKVELLHLVAGLTQSRS
jgi:anti-sigma factor RsiW